MSDKLVEALEPTWADRDAANAIREAMHDGSWGITADAQDWRSDHPLLQAIATWNRRALSSRPDAGEAVAWMYEKGSSATLSLARQRGNVEDGWTETPLYAHPTAAVAGDAVARRMAESVDLDWDVMPDDPDAVCGHGMPEGCKQYWRNLAALSQPAADALGTWEGVRETLARFLHDRFRQRTLDGKGMGRRIMPIWEKQLPEYQGIVRGDAQAILSFISTLSAPRQPDGEVVRADVVALVCAARQILERGYVSTSIPEERADAEALAKALEAFASRVCWDDDGGTLPEAHADPCTCGLASTKAPEAQAQGEG
jgi:hypothetical protein